MLVGSADYLLYLLFDACLLLLVVLYCCLMLLIIMCLLVICFDSVVAVIVDLGITVNWVVVVMVSWLLLGIDLIVVFIYIYWFECCVYMNVVLLMFVVCLR